MFIKVAYSDTGLRQSLKYMEVETLEDWKIINATQIFVIFCKRKITFWKIMRQISYNQETLLVVPCLQGAVVYEFVIGTVEYFR